MPLSESFWQPFRFKDSRFCKESKHCKINTIFSITFHQMTKPWTITHVTLEIYFVMVQKNYSTRYYVQVSTVMVQLIILFQINASKNMAIDAIFDVTSSQQKNAQQLHIKMLNRIPPLSLSFYLLTGEISSSNHESDLQLKLFNK